LAAACGGAATPAADIHPGVGQKLAGMPGATGNSTPGTSSSPMSMPSTPAAAGTQTQAQPAQFGANSIEIKNFAFAPSAVTVKVGTTVTWTNDDTDEHTVTSQHVGPLKSAALATGGQYSFTFTKPGTYAYLCTIHPFMTATVTVTA
jgi:plastocyanin